MDAGETSGPRRPSATPTGRRPIRSAEFAEQPPPFAVETLQARLAYRRIVGRRRVDSDARQNEGRMEIHNVRRLTENVLARRAFRQGGRSRRPRLVRRE